MSKGVYIQNVSVLGVYVWVMCLRGYIYIYYVFGYVSREVYVRGMCLGFVLRALPRHNYPGKYVFFHMKCLVVTSSRN